MKQLLAHSSWDQQVIAKTLTPYTGTGGLYSSVVPELVSGAKILSLCSKLDIEVTEQDELHCTVIYSPETTLDKIRVVRNISNNRTQAKVIGFEVFGEERDHLVITLQSPDLASLHQKWLALGCVSTWPHYQPHVSIAKTKGKAFDEKMVAKATAWIAAHPEIVLNFLPEQIEDIS